MLEGCYCLHDLHTLSEATRISLGCRMRAPFIYVSNEVMEMGTTKTE